MRLPRGLQTGPVPTGPVTLQSDATGAARLARQVSDFADLIVEEQAQAEFADAVSSAEIATREYLARSKGIRINSDTGRPAFETAEQDFESFYSDLETSVAKNLTSNRARDRVSEQLKLMRENAQADVRSIARGHQIDDIVTRTSASVDRYVAAGEYDAARLALQNQKAHFSPQNMQRISDYIDSAQSGALHDQAINDVMAQHAEAMRQGQSAEFIRNFRASNHFEDEETRKLASKMLAQNREYQAEQDELDTEFKAQEARALQARLYVVDERIDRGDPSVMGDIEEMLAAGDITAATASDKRRRLERALEDNRAVTDGYAILSAGGILDPKNKHHRRLVDNELAVIVQEGGGIDQPETRSAIARLIQQTNIVPDSVMKTATSSRIAGDPVQVASMADIVARVAEVAPVQYAQFSQDDRAFYGLVNRLVRANMDPTDSVQIARERINQPDTDRDIANQRYQDAQRSDPNIEAATDWAQDQFDEFFGFAPDEAGIPNELLADYESLTRVFFDKTKDIGTARELAEAQLSAVWGRTEVNGEAEVMRYAPEAVHGPWTREQIASDMTDLGIEEGEYQVISDNITARTSGGSYALMRRTPYGVEPIVREGENGLEVVRYQPDFAITKDADRLAERKRFVVREAEKKRDQLLAQEAADREAILKGDPAAASAIFGAD